MTDRVSIIDIRSCKSIALVRVDASRAKFSGDLQDIFGMFNLFFAATHELFDAFR